MAIIDRVKYDGTSDGKWLVHKYPGEQFVLGTQLIVGEGQVALFVKGGQALDLFGPGTHTLSTGNIPILLKLVNIPFGNKTPFTAEIYYINTILNMELKWGTESPIQIVDPVYRVRINARANGQYTLRVDDYRMLITQLIGSRKGGTTITFNELVPGFKGIVLSSMDTMLAKYIVEQKVSVLEIRTKQREIAALCHEEMKGEFNLFGMELVNFFINSINFPDEDMAVINGILERKAEFDILGDARYAAEKQFEIMGDFARNDSVSAMANAGVGLGLGLGVVGQVGNTFSAISNQTIGQPAQSSPSQTGIPCKQCSSLNSSDAKFCQECGNKMNTTKSCPSCEAENAEHSKFCQECGTSLGARKCSGCQAELVPGAKFCNACGTAAE